MAGWSIRCSMWIIQYYPMGEEWRPGCFTQSIWSIYLIPAVFCNGSKLKKSYWLCSQRQTFHRTPTAFKLWTFGFQHRLQHHHALLKALTCMIALLSCLNYLQSYKSKLVSGANQLQSRCSKYRLSALSQTTNYPLKWSSSMLQWSTNVLSQSAITRSCICQLC